MNEDEAVNILKTMCTDNFCIEQLKTKQAIETILDLYQKEKEKNKELEKADLTMVYMNGFYDGEKKWKDKIRAKIKQIEDAIEPWDDEDLRYQLKIKDKAQIEVLKELLEEE